jgi:hypothetical protein
MPFVDGGVHVYPTLLFVDREGRLRRVHVGFYSPAAGEARQALLLDLEAELDALLAEDAGGPAPLRTGTPGNEAPAGTSLSP